MIKGIKKTISEYKLARSYGHFWSIWYDTKGKEVWCNSFPSCNTWVDYSNEPDYILIAKRFYINGHGKFTFPYGTFPELDNDPTFEKDVINMKNLRKVLDVIERSGENAL